MFDAIVVGAGGTMGSSALYHLAKSGVKVLGLESQPDAPHSHGSHHGQTRVIRTAYVEHPSYVPLLSRAHQLWRELEQASGQNLLETTGCIYASAGGLAGSCTQHAIAVAGKHGLRHSILTQAAAASLFPGYRAFPEDAQFMYEPEAAVLQPEGCIRASLGLALSAGAELVCGASVTAWRVDGQGVVHVHTSKGEYQGRKLILAPGAWLPKLVPELKSLLNVERQVVGWFEVLEGSADYNADRFPMFVMDDKEGCYYGFPKDASGFKFGKIHHLEETVDPDRVARHITIRDQATLRRALQKYFPGASGALKHAAVCLYTITPDEHFLVDLHPSHAQVILCSACSGQGFKFGSVMGEVLKDLAVGGSTRHDIAFMRLDRTRPGHAQVLDSFEQGAKDLHLPSRL